MSKKAGFIRGQRRLLAVLLLIAAAVMLFLAWQSVSTEQYLLYDRNYHYYVNQAKECRDMVDSALGAHYAFLATEWEETAKEAGAYLTQHRAGAASLGVVSLACIALGITWLVKGSTAKAKDEDEHKKPTQQKKA